MKKIIVKIIKFYQIVISPLLGDNCRFYPSCSEYTLKSINKYGTLKGGIKGIKRLLRCHPFSGGGVDLP